MSVRHLSTVLLLVFAACRGPEISLEVGESGSSSETGPPDPDCHAWSNDPQPLGVPSDLQLDFSDASAEFGDADTAYYPGDWPPHCDPTQQGWVTAPCKMILQAGGAAVGDFDADGWPDIYLARLVGGGLLLRNQLGDGLTPAFVDVAVERGMVEQFGGNGAAWVDIDGDRDLDLYVSAIDNPGRMWLYVNQLSETGTASFVEAAHDHALALDDDRVHYGFSIGVGDYDRDGWLDLFTTEWLPGGSVTDDNSHARLFHNLGSGMYEDTTLQAGVSMVMINPEGVYTLSPAFVDLDEDGWQDLAIVSDNGTTRLFWNRGDGSFKDGTPTAGVGIERNGMGSAFADFDGDTHLDWYVTAIFTADTNLECGNPVCGRGGNRLYRSVGPRCFEELAEDLGVNVGGWGWGTSTWDPDNDGDMDIVEINGFVTPHGPPGLVFVGDPMRYWANVSEQIGVLGFEERSGPVGLLDTGQGRGLVVFDYDRDGDEDLLTVDFGGIAGGSTKLWRNETGNQNDWLAVELDGNGGNRHGVGARVELRRTADAPVQMQIIGIGGHYLGHREYRAHFGLGPGAGSVYELRVLWPSGQVSVLDHVGPRQTVVVAEPG